MKVLVTGGTGFVGSHIAVELLRQGHDVRLLARRAQQVAVTFAPHGVDVSDVVEGDVLSTTAVAQAVEGCDAVVHAAAVFSIDSRRAGEVLGTNETATRIVLSRALQEGLDPVVHISSTVALTGGGGGGPGLHLGDLNGPYARSKRMSEEFARAQQDTGAPVVSIYPGGCLGPDDPYLGDQNARLRWVVRGLFPFWPTGAYHLTDVRTVARVVAAVMEPGRGPRRVVVPGTHMDAQLLYGTLADVTGRRFPHVALPGAVIGPMSASMGVVQSRLPGSWHYPADHEGTLLSLADTRIDDTSGRLGLNIDPVPFEDTVRDTVAWMARAGHITRRQAGRALEPAG